MANKSLKIVAALVALYWVFLVLLRLPDGITPYVAGNLAGKLFFCIIVVYAMLKLPKYGWGISLFILAAFLFSETNLFIQSLRTAAPANRLAMWALFLVVNSPVIAAIPLMLLKSTRAPFRRVRGDQ